jgi:DNA-directed RNA polymerase sigma subunit (sigma70/sigma32)
MAAAVSALPEREATVVRMRFGLDGIAPHELAEIGVVIGCSKQRVEIILKQALATLRRSVTPEQKAAA